jgi:shikimate dehydrogenase
LLHAAGYAALGLTDWSYGSHEVDAAGLAGFVGGLGPEWRGLSLTMPLKEAALEVAAEVSDIVAAAGAANTLVRASDGSWRADNTDVAGIVEALRPHLLGPVKTGLVLGSGATARSALLALARLGATRLTVAARDAAKAEVLAAWAARPEVGVGLVATAPLTAWGALPADVVVSAVAPAGGAAAAAALGRRGSGVLLDVVYAGWPTPLATAALESGLIVVPGVEMLVHQAAVQFEMFTGHTAPVAQMLRIGRAALEG